MDDILLRLLDDKIFDTPDLRREAATEIARLRGEIRIGAERLAIAAGVCKEWADRLHALRRQE